MSFTRYANGKGAEELFIAGGAPGTKSFSEALKVLSDSYSQTAHDLDLGTNTVVFSRFFLSDAFNQTRELRSTELFKNLSAGAVSIVEQAPLGGDPLMLFSYHIRSGDRSLRRSSLANSPECFRNGVSLQNNKYHVLWIADYSSNRSDNEAVQTSALFEKIESDLGECAMEIRHNLIRTWVFVRDIDTRYAGMVGARKVFFKERGLDYCTRYVASTGIEGKGENLRSLVTIDAMSIGGIKEEQILRMEALDHMSPTINYGVTFERGLRVRFGDRSHLFISGTASIDNKGDILHPSDPCRQAIRTIENIGALLKNQNARLSDMRYFILYLRNPKDYPAVRDTVASLLPPDIPVIPVKASVCRPGWLVEFEGVAIIDDTTEYPGFF